MMQEGSFLWFFIGSLWDGGLSTITPVHKNRLRNSLCPCIVMRLKTLGLRPRCTEKVQVTQETSFPCVPVPPQENIENKRLKKRAILATRMLLLEALVVSVPNWPVHSAG